MPEKLAGLVLQEEVRQWAGYICAGASAIPAFPGLEFALASPACVHEQHPSEAKLLVMSTMLWVKGLNGLWTSYAWSYCAFSGIPLESPSQLWVNSLWHLRILCTWLVLHWRVLCLCHVSQSRGMFQTQVSPGVAPTQGVNLRQVTCSVWEARVMVG